MDSFNISQLESGLQMSSKRQCEFGIQFQALTSHNSHVNSGNHHLRIAVSYTCQFHSCGRGGTHVTEVMSLAGFSSIISRINEKNRRYPEHKLKIDKRLFLLVCIISIIHMKRLGVNRDSSEN